MIKTIKDIQRQLTALGFDTGGVDGIRGPKTEQAIIDFKRSRGLRARPFVGSATLAALFPDSGSCGSPVPEWLQAAEAYKGLREVPGSGNNQTILDWAEDLDIHYPGDDIPWCGLFVGHCIGSSLPGTKLPDNILGARKWLSYGQECEPVYGAILVFWRGSKNGWKGHVGFYYGEDDEAYHVLGGNQSNGVNVTRIAKNRLLEARWPSERIISGEKVFLSNTGEPLSTNEA
jgi:uncharacterized protein (TIGR02594 family)